MVQFQLKGWTSDGTCVNPDVIIEVLDRISVVQRKSGNKPILVHGRYVFSESQATSLSWCMGGMCLTKVRQQAYPGAWEVCV